MRDTVSGVTGWILAALWRDGGQRQARRNAWAAMVGDNQRARARAEAAAAVAALERRHAAEQPVVAAR